MAKPPAHHADASNDLRASTDGTTAGGRRDADPVVRAEQALATLSEHFSTWMEDECNRLAGARGKIRLLGLTAETAKALFQAAHDIKGEAATLGFPLVAPAAVSLCTLVEHARDTSAIPLALIEQHVEACLTIMHAQGRTDGGEIAARLIRDLTRATTDYLMAEDVGALDDTGMIESPPLVPHR